MPIQLQIKYGPDREFARVRWTLKRLPWFRKQGYHENFAKLPQGIVETSSDDEIRAHIAAEYEGQQFADMSRYISGRWSEVSDGFARLRALPGVRMDDTYIVELTRYGSGGSYHPDTSSIDIRITDRNKENIIGTVVHEIVHISIQHLMEKYAVSHWRKERLVDLLLDHCFPSLHKMQPIPEDVSCVDDAFTEYFPDVDAIAHATGAYFES